jgi:hypothetical protein
MELFDNIDIYPKIIVALTGFIAAFIKIRDSYSSTRHKENIKLDLEIYELLDKSGDFEKAELKEKIQKNISNTLTNEENGLTNFFVGLVVFVGFGLWSVDIYQTHESFNGWIILTTFCSLTGLSMLFGGNDKRKSKAVFYQIGFYDKTNFQFGFIITSLTAILTPILILKMNGFSFWQFLSGLFFVIGLMSVIKNIKRIN